MWSTALITTGAAAFGRLFLVGILPSTLITTTLWILLRARALDPAVHGLTASQLIPADFSIDKGGSLLLALITIVILTAIFQTFHIGMVRVLEGYWGASPVAVILFSARVRRHRRRFGRAITEVTETALELRAQRAAPEASARLPEQAAQLRAIVRTGLRHERARLRLSTYPPYENELLPTRLGNALRSGERRAGERYGWSTVHAWPRLFPRVAEPLAVAYRSSVDAVDSAAVFCLVFAVITVVTGIAFYNDPTLLWVPLVAGLLAFVSYRGAVVGALHQGVLQQVAFDLHRFDLLESLHYKLPDSIEDELPRAQQVSTFMADGTVPDMSPVLLAGLQYSHQSSNGNDGSDAAHQRSTTTAPARPLRRSRSAEDPASSKESRRPRSSKATESGGGPSRTTGQ